MVSVKNPSYPATSSYWDEIPKNTLTTMTGMFVVSFVIRTITTNDLRTGLIGGILSATATGIYGLVSPLFKRMSGSTQLSWTGEMCRTFTSIIGAGAVGQQAFGESKILNKLVGSAIVYGIFIFLDPERKNLNMTHWIYV